MHHVGWPYFENRASLHVRQSSLCCVLRGCGKFGAGKFARSRLSVSFGEKVWVTLFITRDFVGASPLSARVRNDAGRCNDRLMMIDDCLRCLRSLRRQR